MKTWLSVDGVVRTICEMHVFGVEPEMVLTPYDCFGVNAIQGPCKQIGIREVPGEFEPIVVPTAETAYLWRTVLRKIEEASLDAARRVLDKGRSSS